MKTPAPLTNQAPDEKLEAADRLDSWKEIAAYLKRDVRTVRRWEKSGGLPVRRHLHQRQASVFAYRSELDAWWQNEQKGLEQPETASEAAARPHAWKWGLALAAALILLCLAVYLADRNTVRASAPGRTMLAVLPFQNLGGGNDKDYICDGLTEDLGTELTMLDPARVGVIARTSSMTYKGRTSNVRDIGRELGVQYVIEGSVRFGSERSRVNVQLIRVADQSHVWAQSFEALPGEMFALEQDIARRVAGEVDVRLNQAAPAKPREAVNPDAYRLYLQGRELWGKRSQADLEHSIEALPGGAEVRSALRPRLRRHRRFLQSTGISRLSSLGLYGPGGTAGRTKSPRTRSHPGPGACRHGLHQRHVGLGLERSREPVPAGD